MNSKIDKLYYPSFYAIKTLSLKILFIDSKVNRQGLIDLNMGIGFTDDPCLEGLWRDGGMTILSHVASTTEDTFAGSTCCRASQDIQCVVSQARWKVLSLNEFKMY